MRHETVSYLKANAASLEVNEPVIITQHGKPTYVIESYESHERREQSLALLKLLALGEKSRQQGRSLTIDEARERLRYRREASQVQD